MKLVTYNNQSENRIGLVINQKIYDLNQIDSTIPKDMLSFLKDGELAMQKAKIVEEN